VRASVNVTAPPYNGSGSVTTIACTVKVDHAMLTGLLGARRALSIKRYDRWLVNIHAEYLEGAPAVSTTARVSNRREAD